MAARRSCRGDDMADLKEILQIITLVRDIIALLQGMGLKMTGEVSVGDILKLVNR
jgi:hypothetical protein